MKAVAHHVELLATRKGQESWRWTCTCGASGEGYSTPNKAEQAARIHVPVRPPSAKKNTIDIRPETPDDEACDFCSVHAEELWVYPANDFQVATAVPGLQPMQSCGFWAACVICHDLIERGQRDALLHRSVETLGKEMPLAIRMMGRAAIQDLHQDFFKHRLGPAERRLKPKGTA